LFPLPDDFAGDRLAAFARPKEKLLPQALTGINSAGNIHPSTQQHRVRASKVAHRSLTDWEHRGGVCFGIQRDQQIPRPMPALELAVAPHAATRSCATAALEDASS